ncbi:MAG: lytic transglycosylase domain-containing protein [Actinobacteria bacterium]|nr:lytic transglycosylase domain-containing protein [Actinomycetota bacterium]
MTLNLAWLRRFRWVLLLIGLAAVAFFSGKGLLYRLYPLPYRQIIEQRAAQFNLDPLLVAAVIRTESKFNPGAVSKKGARGLMQVMPSTGEWAADRLKIPGFSLDRLFDPDVNVWIGTWYLDRLRRDFGGDLVLALAAYNGGSGHVKDWLQSSQWTGEQRTIEQIPFRETRNFVDRVMKDYRMYHLLYRRRSDLR